MTIALPNNLAETLSSTAASGTEIAGKLLHDVSQAAGDTADDAVRRVRRFVRAARTGNLSNSSARRGRRVRVAGVVGVAVLIIVVVVRRYNRTGASPFDAGHHGEARPSSTSSMNGVPAAEHGIAPSDDRLDAVEQRVHQK